MKAPIQGALSFRKGKTMNKMNVNKFEHKVLQSLRKVQEGGSLRDCLDVVFGVLFEFLEPKQVQKTPKKVVQRPIIKKTVEKIQPVIPAPENAIPVLTADFIRDELQKRGMTVATLAKSVGYSDTHIYNVTAKRVPVTRAFSDKVLTFFKDSLLKEVGAPPQVAEVKAPTVIKGKHPGVVLKTLATEKGMTVSKLSEISKVSIGHIYKLYSGRAPMSEAIAEELAKALMVPSDVLLKPVKKYQKFLQKQKASQTVAHEENSGNRGHSRMSGGVQELGGSHQAQLTG